MCRTVVVSSGNERRDRTGYEAGHPVNDGAWPAFLKLVPESHPYSGIRH